MHDAAEAYQAWRHGINVGPWKQAPPNADVLRPRQGAQSDPVLRARLLREVPTLSRCDRALLLRLLAGEELPDIAEAEEVKYITVHMRYRHLLRTLKHRLTGKSTSPTKRFTDARGTTQSGMPQHECSTSAPTP